MASENESEWRKTVADIVAEYRADMDAVDRGDLPLPTTGFVRILLDRIEAIWKREKAAIEADALAVGGVVEAARELSKKRPESGGEIGQFGNAAAMREALVQCELFLGNVSRHGHPTLNPGDKCTACDGVDELREMVVRALAAPPRNCDVGTAEEQSRRFANLCNKYYDDENACKKRCPLTSFDIIHGFPRCQAYWEQMPYEAKEGGAA